MLRPPKPSRPFAYASPSGSHTESFRRDAATRMDTSASAVPTGQDAPEAAAPPRGDNYHLLLTRRAQHHAWLRRVRGNTLYRRTGSCLREYLRVWGPVIIAVGGHRYCCRVPGCRAVGGRWRPTARALCRDLAGGVFSHVVAAGLDPDGVMHDAVHDGVGVNPGAEALVPVLLGVLGAEHR